MDDLQDVNEQLNKDAILDNEEEKKTEKEKESESENPVTRQSVQNPGSPLAQAQGKAPVVPAIVRPQLNQTVTNQTAAIPGKNTSNFSRAGFEFISKKPIGKLPETYQRIGTLLDDYGTMIQNGENSSEQGRERLLTNLNAIKDLTDTYRNMEKNKINNGNVMRAMGVFRRVAIEKIQGLQNGEPNPNYSIWRAAQRTSGPLPMPGRKPVAQQPIAQQPVAQQSVAQQSVAQQPVVQQPVAQENRQTNEVQKEANAEPGANEQTSNEQTSNEQASNEQASNEQASSVPAEPTGPSLREKLMAMMEKSAVESAREDNVRKWDKRSRQRYAALVGDYSYPKGETAADFTKWGVILNDSDKGGLGWKNSKYFHAVQEALYHASGVLTYSFGNDPKTNIALLKAASEAFQQLLDACKQYTTRNPRTKNGKVRREIVLQIQKYAENDLYGCGSKIVEFSNMPPEDQAKEDWQSVLGSARAMRLTVEDYSKLGSAEGGAASDTIKIELQEGDRAVTKYFKKEDSFNLEIIKEKGDDAPHYFAMQDTLQKYPNLSEKDKELLQELSRDASLENKDFSEEGLLAAEYCKKRTAQVKTTIESLMISLGITEEGGMANMSRRNVATSRIAELLGLENLVAKSRTVDILDQATGQTIRGNLMDQAEGKEYDKVENAITENKIDSGFIRDLTNLQVLDILCGQVDRHRNNMLYKTDDQGTVIGVQGIDNDGAFGTNTDVASAKNPYRKDLRVFDPETLEMIIPFMDDGLATRIEQLDSATIRYVLKDLLTDEEIEATGKRLDLLQKGIKKARDEHSDRFLKEEKDWTVGINNQDPNKEKDPNKKTVEEKMLDSYDDNFANSDPDSDVNKERIKKMAAEKFKDDPKIVSGINLFYDDENKFFEKYSSEEIREIMRERLKLREIIRDEGKVTYRNNRNYFGRIMRKHDH